MAAPFEDVQSSICLSLPCGPISPVVNLEMSSTASFFVEMQYMDARD